jgi:ADP-sugar diphosphatase
VPQGSQSEKHVLLTIQPRIPAASLAFTELPAGMVDSSGTFGGAAAREIEEELGKQRDWKSPLHSLSTHPKHKAAWHSQFFLSTGLTIPADQLINLSELALQASSTSSQPSNGVVEEEELPQAIFPSPGGCDEHISIFLHEKRVPRETLKDWTGKLTGLRDDGEKITLKLVKLEDLWKEGGRDGKAAAAWGLYVGLKGEGRI